MEEPLDSKNPNSLKMTYEAVAHVRMPQAVEVTKSNLDRAKKFLSKLEGDPDFREKAKTTRSLLHLVEQQLKDELVPVLELKKTISAGMLLGTSRKPMTVSVESGGANAKQQTWSVQVPQFDPLVSSPAVIQELADGTPYSKLDEKDPLRAEVGEAIVKTTLDGFFKQGKMNSDPHNGNFLVKGKIRNLFPLDFGQFEEEDLKGSHDIRHQIGEWITLISERPSPLTTDWLQKLFEASLRLLHEPLPDGRKSALRKTFETNIKEAFKPPLKDDPLILGINTLVESDLSPRKSVFGVFKGLSILFQEKYVPEARFKQLLRSYIVALKGTPYVYLDRISQWANSSNRDFKTGSCDPGH